ncbi:MAG: substrate-binding domain-containing protein [Acidimicrobiales bacterium]
MIGVDDHPIAWVEDLTTIHQSIRNHGATAARLVLELMASDDPQAQRRIELGTTLVERRSTAPPDPNGAPR